MVRGLRTKLDLTTKMSKITLWQWQFSEKGVWYSIIILQYKSLRAFLNVALSTRGEFFTYVAKPRGAENFLKFETDLNFSRPRFSENKVQIKKANGLIIAQSIVTRLTRFWEY